MELYVRPVTIFDKNIVTDFAQEHYAVNEKIEAGDCSLILGRSYDEYEDFYDWLKEEEKLDQEEKLKKGGRTAAVAHEAWPQGIPGPGSV